MNAIIATLIEAGGKLFSEMVRIKQIESYHAVVPEQAMPELPHLPQITTDIYSVPNTNPSYNEPESLESKATGVKSGCIPCALGHTGTCSGLLNEAVRFSKDGINNPDVIDRVNMCLDELNAMERVDLRPQMIEHLSDWEKDLAQQTLNESRKLRHELESIKTADDLSHLAAATQTLRTTIGRQWFEHKLESLPPNLQAKIGEKLDEHDKMMNNQNEGM